VTKDKLVVEIPLVAGIRPIVVEPKTIIIPVDIEDVRIVIGVGPYMPRHPSHCQPNPPKCRRNSAVYYLRSKIDQRSIPSLFFLKSTRKSSVESLSKIKKFLFFKSPPTLSIYACEKGLEKP
jgi:hypothetical protein